MQAADLEAALALSEAFAPEHLELQGADAEALAPRITRAGCLFVALSAAVIDAQFQLPGSVRGLLDRGRNKVLDSVVGELLDLDHTLPTGGAARFASGLGVRHFRRRMAEVRIGAAASALAGPGALLARVEGFDVHAESMEDRENEER